MLTIFTPTYNRAYILPQLYQSLCSQTDKNFEWLIVDDGSTDNTEDIIRAWIKENAISIRYFKQENGGKMRAHNRGVKEALYELFLNVDSDDYIVNNTVEMILQYSNKLINNNLSGIIAYRGYESYKNLVKCEFPEDKKKTTLSGLYKKGFTGETSLIFKTIILKQHLFPEIRGEKFVTEAYIYDKIDQKYEMLLLPEIIIRSKYLEDGYTQNDLLLKQSNPLGWSMFFNQRSLYADNFKEKIRMTSYYICYGLIGKKKNIITSSFSPLFAIVCYPLGLWLKKGIINEFSSLNN